WFRHLGGSDFTPYVIDETQRASRIAVGDLNGDGRLEVVMAPADEIGRLKWYACAGDPRAPGAWTGHELLERDVVHGHSLAVGDLDGDGDFDICAKSYTWDAPRIDLWLCDR